MWLWLIIGWFIGSFFGLGQVMAMLGKGKQASG